jgi:uncharacterized protein YjbI with pentapeptide repeats
MKRKEPFNQLEQWLQQVPTWLFVGVEIIILALITLWLETSTIRSFRDAVRVVFENAESIALVAAVILFFKEAPSRKAQKHYEAWQVIDNAAAAKVSTSYARIQALQDLNEDGVSLLGISLANAHLQRIDLHGSILMSADLSGVDLSGANLRGANLNHANLSRSILIDTDLRRANIGVADLRGAILGIADLALADLRDADLRDASLSGANLHKAILRDADLRGADLRDVILQDADLNCTDLREVKNLTLAQIRSARCWEQAIYDKVVYQKLELPQRNS